MPPIHAIVVGSDVSAQTKFETELRNFVMSKKIQDRVHFVNKTLTVAPYLAAIDVLVQNSQVLPQKTSGFLSQHYCELLGRPFATLHVRIAFVFTLTETVGFCQFQARGECFGRITIEAMAFQLPVLVKKLLLFLYYGIWMKLLNFIYHYFVSYS